MAQTVRVRLREDMVLMARDAGHYRVANELRTGNHSRRSGRAVDHSAKGREKGRGRVDAPSRSSHRSASARIRRSRLLPSA
jgi:hypothetical protein